jgi:uncharacterized RDD family membrane protein YckC
MPEAVQPVPASPEGFSRRYDSSIVVRRWGATWIDMLLLVLCGVAPLALPENVQPTAFLFAVLVVVGYYPVLEHLYGRTAGKLVCRVRVVDDAGARPSWGQAAIRTVLRLLEVNPALLGGVPAGIVVLSSKKRQRLGDMAANTFVLREEDYRYLTLQRTLAAPVRPGLQNDVAFATIQPPPLPPPSTAADSWLIPRNRSGWCIAAGYLGLFAVLGLPAPFALAAGLIGLRDLRRHPGLGGRGRALFGIIMGALFSLLFLVAIVLSVVGSK